MFYALIVICLIGVGKCDIDNATFAEQSAADFDTAEECFYSAKLHATSNWHLVKVLAKRPMTDFKIGIYCTEIGRPA